ncbi:MAG: hypothetical protein JXB49_06195 [Bacteroidales bacterium]|nr:hypothetical protein [Bacteroidales bacterium]
MKRKRTIQYLAFSFLFIALTFIFDQVLGKVLHYFYFRSEYGAIYHLTYSLDSTEADVIILGSSRAHNHYVPKIIEDRLDLTCFNTGMDGNYMFTSFAIYKSLVNRYNPKIVLLDISLNELYKGSGNHDELSSLLPYYKNKPEIRDIILLKSKFERLKLISKIYPFNSTLLAVAEGNIRTEDINELKGYLPLNGSLIDTCIGPIRTITQEVDTNKIRVLEEIASDCEIKNIRLIFIQSPAYTRTTQEKSASILNKLATKHKAEFWNYINDTMFLKAEYFKDKSHMNALGSYEFTKSISNRF